MKRQLCLIFMIVLFPAALTAQTQLTVTGATTIQPICEAASEAFCAETGRQIIKEAGFLPLN